MSTLILRTAAGLLVPLALIFSLFVFFKGHQTPGGGFVSGLVAAVGLIVFRMSHGHDALNRLLPATERTMIALGLLLALGTGVGALAVGLPFLTSNNDYIRLPGGIPDVDMFHWATVLAFDLGVFLVVAGTVVGMINALSQQTERDA